MNSFFLRNIFSVFVLIWFVLDLIFGNGVDWRDWICGAAFLVSLENLLSTLEEHLDNRKIYKMDETFWANVASVLIIGSFVFSLIFGENLWVWDDWLIGAVTAYAVLNLLKNFGSLYSQREMFGVKIKRFFQRLGRTRFLILFFIPFGVWGLYSNGWQGLLTAIFGFGVGNFIYNRWLQKRFFN